MPTIITMPAFSSTMESGKLIKWLVSEGDKVKTGQPLAEIETDKAVAEIESSTDGYLARIIISEPDTDVPVNDTIGIILKENETEEDLKDFCSPGSDSNNAGDKTASDQAKDSLKGTDTETAPVKSSPGARRAADEAGIDISQVRGSGPKGRITKDDVLAHIADMAGNTERDASSGTTAEVSSTGDNEITPITPMRSAIARRLAESKRDIPHFYIEVDIYLDALLAAKHDGPGKDPGKQLSLNIYFIKAAALAVNESPGVNAVWADDKIVNNKHCNIGMAVAIDEGLVVPVLQEADRKELSQLNNEANELIRLARAGKLPQSKISNSSITISNLGMHNVSRFYAIINPPESCILALGTTSKKPVVIDNGIHIRNVMTCTMSADHRLVDGVTAAKFLNSFKQFLENPSDWT
ncbi:MAG: dihydrolipoamide acetyltransferase family protein [Gammaproteobacteria bacterium]